MGTFIFILFLMLLGYTLKKLKIFPEQTSQVLNLFIIYISLPAIIINEVPKITFSSEIMIPVFIAWVTTILGAISILVFSKLFKLNRNTTGALLLVAVLGNTSFIGIPMVSHYFGTEGLPYVIIYDQMGTFLALSTYGAVVVAIYSDNGGAKVSVQNVLKKIFKFPPFISLLIAFALNGIEFNADVSKALSTLGNTLIPLALISVGYNLQLKIPKKDISPFILGIVNKLILLPTFAFIIVHIFDFEGFITDITLLESAMGPMITAGVVASMAGLAPKLVSSILGYGIFISIATIAAVYQLIQIF
ncbi:AEC family transporter [Arcobacter sp. 15-2]|uniref:AEC family transporter n=1 Tax=Arcobacter sp. 15-2 TaxID=3374109 RepID=UPI00399CF67F